MKPARRTLPRFYLGKHKSEAETLREYARSLLTDLELTVHHTAAVIESAARIIEAKNITIDALKQPKRKAAK